MNLEDVKYYFQTEKDKRVSKIEENYKNYTSSICNKIKMTVYDKIKDYFRDIDLKRIESYLDDNFINPIMNNSQKYIGEIDGALYNLIYSISRDLEESIEESRINASIDQSVSEITMANSLNNLNTNISECLASLRSYVCYSYQTPFFSHSQIENLYFDLEHDLRNYLTSEVNKLAEFMNTETKKELNSLSTNYKNQIHEFRSQEKNSSLESEYAPIIEMAGLRVVKENDTMYIVDQDNNYHEFDGDRRTIDNQFTMLSNNIGEYSIADFTRNISIISDNLTTRIINKETNERIKIEYGFDGYEFTINEKKIEDKQGRKDFINMLYQNYPGVYNHLCEDPFLGKECRDAINEINEIVSANAAMFIDDFKKDTESMLNELDQVEQSQNEQAFFSDEEKSLDDQIFELEQNPIVQRYLELKKLQEEKNNDVLSAILL